MSRIGTRVRQGPKGQDGIFAITGPTGAGKTLTASRVVLDVMEATDEPGIVSVWVAPQKELLQQASGRRVMVVGLDHREDVVGEVGRRFQPEDRRLYL